MYIDQLTLRNFCQHRSRQFEFQPGLTAIVGPNGSGKSNVFGAIQFALTGENPNAGVKADNVCQLADASEPSYVSLAFRHGSAQAVVTRRLRPYAKPTLEVTGAPTITGDGPVNQAIQEILGIDFSLLNSVVLVAQGDIFGFLSEAPARRAEALQRLFRTDGAEKIYTAIGQCLSTMTVPKVATDIDVLRLRLMEAQAQYVALREQLAQRRSAEEVQQAYFAALSVCSEWEQRCQQQERCETLRGRLDSVVAERKRSEETLAKLMTSWQAVTAALDTRREEADRARAALLQLSQQEAMVRRTETLRAQLAIRERELSELAPPTAPPDYCQPPAFREELDKLAAEIREDERFLSSLDPEAGVTECPLCRTPVVTLADRYVQVERTLPEKRKEYEEKTRRYQRSVQYDTALAQYTSRRERLTEQLLHLQGELAYLQPLLPSVGLPDKTKLEEVVQAYDDLVQQEKGYAESVRGWQGIVARVQGTEGELRQQLQETEALLAKSRVTEELAKSAQAESRRLQEELAETMQLNNALAALRATIETMLRQKREAKEAMDRAAAVLATITHLTELRAMFHKDGAPRFVSQANLQRLSCGTNEYLQLLGAEFRVTADDKLSFTAQFPDGRTQPADRLSGGQKVVLALAFRLAAYFAYAGDMAFLAMDEPTAYLDATTVGALGETLGHLRGMIASRGMQMLLITHEMSLQGAFDKVITLAG